MEQTYYALLDAQIKLLSANIQAGISLPSMPIPGDDGDAQDE